MIDIRNENILITGGAGFIGSSLSKFLSDKKANVRIFDIADKIKTDQIPADIDFCKGSVLDTNDVMHAMKGCDYVIHLAAMLGVRNTETARMETLNVNILGTINVLNECIKQNVKKIVFSSSSEVYGEQIKLPIAETNPWNPKSIYAITKLANEEYIRAYHQQYGINYTIVRFHNAYGPGQDTRFVLPRFVYMTLNNELPTIYGKGNQTRAFCFIDDIVNGTYLALIHENANSEIINIGNDREPISIKDLAYKVIFISGKDIKPVYIKMEESDRTSEREILNRVPNISKAKKILGYEPKYNLEQGLKKTIEWWISREERS